MGNEFISQEDALKNVDEIKKILSKYGVSIDDSLIVTGYLEEAYAMIMELSSRTAM